MERTINLNADQYEDFLRCLSNLKDICNDVDIRNGMIRQRTTDNSTVFEMDLSPIINDISLAVVDLKNKLDMLKIFSGHEVEISVVEETEDQPGNFTFRDQYSALTIKSPSLDYIDNKFMSEDEMGSVYELTDEDLLLETELTKLITDRTRIISGALNAVAVQIIFNNEMSNLCISTLSKDQHANLIGDVILNTPLDNSFSNISLVPFVIDHDSNIEFKMYVNEDSTVSINKFTTSLGDVDINMYSRSSIIREDVDE